MGKHFDDVPLPGLDDLKARQDVGRSVRRADHTLRPTEAARVSFWRRVVKAPGNGCWIFTGAVSSPDGYGRIAWRDNGRERTVSAHRFALELAYGPLAASVVAEHKCNEPLCVRVGAEHVIQSTQRENLAYAVALGRATGPGNGTVTIKRVARSLAVRRAVKDGWNAVAYARAQTAGRVFNAQQPGLFDNL